MLSSAMVQVFYALQKKVLRYTIPHYRGLLALSGMPKQPGCLKIKSPSLSIGLRDPCPPVLSAARGLHCNRESLCSKTGSQGWRVAFLRDPGVTMAEPRRLCETAQGGARGSSGPFAATGPQLWRDLGNEAHGAPHAATLEQS